MRSRSMVWAITLALVGLANAAAFIDVFVTELVSGDLLWYLGMVVDAFSVVACVIAVVAILDRRNAVEPHSADITPKSP